MLFLRNKERHNGDRKGVYIHVTAMGIKIFYRSRRLEKKKL